MAQWPYLRWRRCGVRNRSQWRFRHEGPGWKGTLAHSSPPWALPPSSKDFSAGMAKAQEATQLASSLGAVQTATNVTGSYLSYGLLKGASDFATDAKKFFADQLKSLIPTVMVPAGTTGRMFITSGVNITGGKSALNNSQSYYDSYNLSRIAVAARLLSILIPPNRYLGKAMGEGARPPGRISTLPSADRSDLPYVPIVTPPEVVRIWVYDHVTPSGDLVVGHYLFVKLKDQKWYIEDQWDDKTPRSPKRVPLSPNDKGGYEHSQQGTGDQGTAPQSKNTRSGLRAQ